MEYSLNFSQPSLQLPKLLSFFQDVREVVVHSFFSDSFVYLYAYWITYFRSLRRWCPWQTALLAQSTQSLPWHTPLLRKKSALKTVRKITNSTLIFKKWISRVLVDTTLASMAKEILTKQSIRSGTCRKIRFLCQLRVNLNSSCPKSGVGSNLEMVPQKWLCSVQRKSIGMPRIIKYRNLYAMSLVVQGPTRLWRKIPRGLNAAGIA